MKINKILVALIFIYAVSLLFYSCGKTYTPAQEKYIKSIQKFRQQKNSEMRNDPNSPFNKDPDAHFSPLKYYKVDPAFVFKSRLYRYKNPDTVKVYGTKGELRKNVRFGYVKINYNNKNYNVNVYKGITKSGDAYYTIWFTDKTTGKETYGVGRYLDFELNPDTSHIYTIDFNLAYNPYCSYSAIYSCAIPTKEDHLDFAVKAGEKKFHN